MLSSECEHGGCCGSRTLTMMWICDHEDLQTNAGRKSEE